MQCKAQINHTEELFIKAANVDKIIELEKNKELGMSRKMRESQPKFLG